MPLKRPPSVGHATTSPCHRQAHIRLRLLNRNFVGEASLLALRQAIRDLVQEFAHDRCSIKGTPLKFKRLDGIIYGSRFRFRIRALVTDTELSREPGGLLHGIPQLASVVGRSPSRILEFVLSRAGQS